MKLCFVIIARPTRWTNIWVCNKCVCSVIWLPTILDAALFCQTYESVVIARPTGWATCPPGPALFCQTYRSVMCVLLSFGSLPGNMA